MAERMPETMREVETRYCVVCVSKLAEPPRIIGGVMTYTHVSSFSTFQTIFAALTHTTSQHRKGMLEAEE